MDKRTREAVGRIKAYLDGERDRFKEGVELHPQQLEPPSPTDWFLIEMDPRARREVKAHVGLIETYSFKR